LYAIHIGANAPGAEEGDKVMFMVVDRTDPKALMADVLRVTVAAAPDYSRTIDYAAATYTYASTSTKHFGDGYLHRVNIASNSDIRAFIIANRALVTKSGTAGVYRLPSGSGATGQRPLDAIIFDYTPATATIHVFHVQ
jgi:hypothetical protein